MLQHLRRLARPATDRGATAVEYALMVAAIAALIVGIVFGLGKVVLNTFTKTCSSISSGTSASTSCA